MRTDFIREVVDSPANLWDIPELQDADVEFYDDDSRSNSFEALLESGHDF